MGQQPREYDAVLGSDSEIPAGAMVLGGVAGLAQRLSQAPVGQRAGLLQEACQYGPAGLKLVIARLQDPSLVVQKAAYLLLRQRPEALVQRALSQYDPYQIYEELAVLEGHRSGITAVAIGADGRTVASGSRDQVLKVWDWWAGEAIYSIQTHGFIYAVTFDPECETVLIRSKNHQVRAWHLKTGQEIRPQGGSGRVIASVTVTADRHLLSGSQNQVKVWDLKAGREICQLQGHRSLVTSVAVCPAAQLLVSGSEDRTVRIWGVA